MDNTYIMTRIFRPRYWAMTALMAAGVAVPAPAQAPTLAMLDGLQTGKWAIKERGAGGSVDQICVRNATQLLQIQHRGLQCSRFIVEDTPTSVTVEYSCPGKGNGRTTIRKETGKLVQIDTQGIANNAPFALTAEGRYAGACSS